MCRGEGSHTIEITASKKMAKQSAIETCSRLEAENPKNEECQISFKTNFKRKNIQTITLNKISIKYYHQKYTNIHSNAYECILKQNKDANIFTWRLLSWVMVQPFDAQWECRK